MLQVRFGRVGWGPPEPQASADENQGANVRLQTLKATSTTFKGLGFRA